VTQSRPREHIVGGIQLARGTTYFHSRQCLTHLRLLGLIYPAVCFVRAAGSSDQSAIYRCCFAIGPGFAACRAETQACTIRSMNYRPQRRAGQCRPASARSWHLHYNSRSTSLANLLPSAQTTRSAGFWRERYLGAALLCKSLFVIMAPASIAPDSCRMATTPDGHQADYQPETCVGLSLRRGGNVVRRHLANRCAGSRRPCVLHSTRNYGATAVGRQLGSDVSGGDPDGYAARRLGIGSVNAVRGLCQSSWCTVSCHSYFGTYTVQARRCSSE